MSRSEQKDDENYDELEKSLLSCKLELKETLRRLDLECENRKNIESLHEDAKKDSNRLRSQLSNQTDKLSALEDEVVGLNHKLKEKLDNEVTLKRSDAEAQKEIDKLNEERTNLQQKLHGILTDKNRENVNFSDLQDRLETEEYFSSLYKNQASKLKEEIKIYNQDLESFSHQLELMKSQLESEQLSRRIAEETSADIDKEKTMLELEIKQLMSRYKHDILSKDMAINVLREKENELIREIDSLSREKDNLNDTLMSANDELYRKSSVSLNSNEQILCMKKQLERETQLKKSAIDKLTQVMQMKDTTNKKTTKKNDWPKRAKDYKKLELDFDQEKRKYNEMVTKYKKELDDLQSLLYQADENKQKLLIDLENKEAELTIWHQQRLITTHEDIDNPPHAALDQVDTSNGTLPLKEPNLESYVFTPFKNAKRKSWRKQLAVMTSKKICFFENDEAKLSAKPDLVLDIDKLFHIRHVTQADVRFANAGDVPKIFQLIYAGEAELSRQSTDEKNHKEYAKQERSDVVPHKGHDFIPISFHSPTNCDICPQTMWSFVKPPPAFECQRCRVKVHRDHLDKRDRDVAPCSVNYDPMLAKDLFVMTSSGDECQRWVSWLKKHLDATPKPLPAPSALSSTLVPGDRSSVASGGSSSNGTFHKDSVKLPYKPYNANPARSSTLPSLSNFPLKKI